MSLLSREQIARIIPHQGAMVLIDEVVHWDEQRLVARSTSHLRSDNPLRDEQGLHIACGIEYAAQAMALHGALSSKRSSDGRAARPRAGLLASVREVRFLAQRLDEDSSALLIEARLVSSDRGGDAEAAMYEFALRSPTRALLTGRATVLLDALKLLNR
jgi:predicted hotdog family 3-hydroxylacyl-ACP dehydratase